MTLSLELAKLDKFEELQKAEKKPQLALYQNNESESLIVYSYKYNFPDDLIPLMHQIVNYFFYMSGYLSFDATKIESYLEKLRKQAVTLTTKFAEKSTIEAVQKAEAEITKLSSQKTALEQNIKSLEEEKRSLTARIKYLDTQTKTGYEEKIRYLENLLARGQLQNRLTNTPFTSRTTYPFYRNRLTNTPLTSRTTYPFYRTRF